MVDGLTVLAVCVLDPFTKGKTLWSLPYITLAGTGYSGWACSISGTDTVAWVFLGVGTPLGNLSYLLLCLISFLALLLALGVSSLLLPGMVFVGLLTCVGMFTS